MPDKEALQLASGQEAEDLRRDRLPALDKPLEELTASEQVQLRPGSEPASAYILDDTAR